MQRPDIAAFWDERYAGDDFFYGVEPNAWLKEQLQSLSPGKILFPAEGEGRNAVYAARLGWQVNAFDISSEGQKKALKLASSFHVNIDYRISRAEDYTVPAETYDAVAMIYTHFPVKTQPVLIKRFRNALKPGGIFLMEVFSMHQINNNSGGPKSMDLLYQIDKMKTYFEGMQIDILEEQSINLDEGRRHRGRADIVRVRAQK